MVEGKRQKEEESKMIHTFISILSEGKRQHNFKKNVKENIAL